MAVADLNLMDAGNRPTAFHPVSNANRELPPPGQHMTGCRSIRLCPQSDIRPKSVSAMPVNNMRFNSTCNEIDDAALAILRGVTDLIST